MPASPSIDPIARLAELDARLFPDDPRTQLGRWWDRHPRCMRTAATAALLLGAVYLVWRVCWSGRDAQPVLWAALLACEFYGWVSLAIGTWFAWHRVPRPSTASSSTDGSPIDVFVCTYNESIDVLRTTLVGCRALRHAHTTWVLDDGNRPEVAALAARCGARYITRPDRRHAKAGNINHALRTTSADLVLVLDADHVPLPHALDQLVGYFADPAVALVQSPHDFFNHDSFQHYSPGRHEQAVFYRVVQPGKDRHGAAFWCGSGALIRRAALEDVGGVATQTIAEDFHTTLRLHAAGWATRYHDEILVRGLAPANLDDYLLQRDRWARGNLAVLATAENPVLAEGLTTSQRLSYCASLFAYLAGPVRALLMVVLAASVWTGRLPITATVDELMWIWLPAVVGALVAGSAVTKGNIRIKEVTHFEFLTAEIHIRAILQLIRGGRGSFSVTPKEGVDRGGIAAVSRLRLLLVLAVALAAGVVARVFDAIGLLGLPDLPGIAAWVVPGLAVVELRRLLRTLWWVMARRQPRRSFRFESNLPARVTAAGRTLPARMVDLSTHGFGLLCSEPLPVGDEVAITVWLPTGDTAVATVSATARVVFTHTDGESMSRVGLSILSMAEQDREAVAEYCYVDRMAREVESWDRLRPVPAVAEIPAAPTPALSMATT